jgi:hypothetical protein
MQQPTWWRAMTTLCCDTTRTSSDSSYVFWGLRSIETTSWWWRKGSSQSEATGCQQTNILPLQPPIDAATVVILKLIKDFYISYYLLSYVLGFHPGRVLSAANHQRQAGPRITGGLLYITESFRTALTPILFVLPSSSEWPHRVVICPILCKMVSRLMLLHQFHSLGLTGG